jgi:uroporphyrinogen-III synthase
MKVKTILVSQPEPKVENSPYFELQQKHKVKIDFRPFIHVEGLMQRDQTSKIDLNNYTAIILTSRNSVDHFLELPMKCVSRYLKV